MPASRTALSACSIVLACAALAACRFATQQNDLHLGDDKAMSAQVSMAPEDAGIDEPSDAMADGADLDVVTDASTDADAPDAVAPPCTQQTMYSSAQSLTCAADSLIISGGTVVPGGYYLTRWADEEKGCTSATTHRQGTMSIEQVGGKLFMRWLVIGDGGKTSWGTYELKPNTTTSFTRSEVCNWNAQTPDVLVSYSASSTDLLFFHGKGQERWTRIPKTKAVDIGAAEPVFTNGM